MDCGAYGGEQIFLTTMTAHTLGGNYRLGAVRLASRAIYTNTAPNGAFRACNGVYNTFALERRIRSTIGVGFGGSYFPGEHLGLGIEVIVLDRDARRRGKILEREGFVRAVAFPIEHGDLGCGSGIWAKELAAAGYRVLGIDLSEAMIAIANRAVEIGEFVSTRNHTLRHRFEQKLAGLTIDHHASPRNPSASILLPAWSKYSGWANSSETSSPALSGRAGSASVTSEWLASLR